MDTQETIEKMRQTEAALTYMAKVMWSEGESTEAVAMEQHVRNVQSALTHLEGAQADKAQLKRIAGVEVFNIFPSHGFSHSEMATEVWPARVEWLRAAAACMLPSVSAMAAQPTQTSV